MTAQWFTSGGLLQGGTWSWDRWIFIYRAETLSNIGFSIIITAVFFVGLTALNKTKLRNKVRVLIKVLILAAFSAAFVFLAPYVQNWASTFAGADLQSIPDHYLDNLSYNYGYYNRWLINSIAGREFPLFPNYSHFLLGAIFGVLISQENPTKRIPRYTALIGLVLTLGGAAYWLLLDGFVVSGSPNFLEVRFHIHPTGFVLFSMGVQMIIIAIALRIYEFNPKMLGEVRQQRMLKLSRWIRRWGIFAMTIFVFNYIEIIPRGIFTTLYPAVDYRGYYQTTLGWTLLMGGIVLLMWEGILRLICLAKGYPSIEYVFLVLFKFGKKPIKKDPLNMQGNFYEVEPVLFVSRD